MGVKVVCILRIAGIVYTVLFIIWLSSNIENKIQVCIDPCENHDKGAGISEASVRDSENVLPSKKEATISEQ